MRGKVLHWNFKERSGANFLLTRVTSSDITPPVSHYKAVQAGIAQLVEHNLAKVGVASSSLVSRSIYILLRFEDSSNLFSS